VVVVQLNGRVYGQVVSAVASTTESALSANAVFVRRPSASLTFPGGQWTWAFSSAMD
jgi:hypothetical protein